MDISRRNFLVGGAGLAVAAPASAQFIKPFVQVLRPLPATQVLHPLTTTAEDSSYSAYGSTLVNGYTPKYPTWLGQTWAADMGSTWNPNMDHCWRSGFAKSRFELHNTTADRSSADPSTKRRTELHDKKHLLANGVEYWGAYSFIDHSWSDPAGMNTKTTGGAHFQMHMPAGGSPAFAFRRYKDGTFQITTCGDNDPVNNHKRYSQVLSFDAVHDIVYRCVIHPTAGQLDVWLDGKQVLSLRNQSIGTSSSGCYPCHGLYYGGGVTCTIVSERGNIAAPTTVNLSARIANAPAWPLS